MRFIKKTDKCVALICAVLSTQILLNVPSFAAETHEQAVTEFTRDKWSVPCVPETALLQTEVWDGIIPLQKNTCYFVEKKTKLSGEATLPEGSTLVIRSGGSLRVGKGAKLTVNGVAVVQSGALLNTLNGGRLLIGESGAAIINGKLAISRNSSALSFGYIQGGGNARINVKGNLKLNGELVSRSKPKLYPSAEVRGADKIEIIGDNARLRYFIEEIYHLGGDMTCQFRGESFAITDPLLKRRIVDNIESVVYRYAGEITAPYGDGFDPVEYSMDFDSSSDPEFFIEDGGEKIRIAYPAGIRATYDIPAPFETIDGFFYVRTLGKNAPEILKALEVLREYSISQSNALR